MPVTFFSNFQIYIMNVKVHIRRNTQWMSAIFWIYKLNDWSIILTTYKTWINLLKDLKWEHSIIIYQKILDLYTNVLNEDTDYTASFTNFSSLTLLCCVCCFCIFLKCFFLFTLCSVCKCMLYIYVWKLYVVPPLIYILYVIENVVFMAINLFIS